MSDWQRELARGKLYLAKHDPESALKCLEKALSACPVNESHDLSKVLFYLGITLNKMGMTDCAIKSWSASQRLEKNGISGKLLKRYTNDYGMAKQKNSELDDWRAFYTLHLNRYLNTKRSRKLGTAAERDMINELIAESWHELRKSKDLEKRTIQERLQIFLSARIVFPTFSARPAVPNTIQVDFNRKKKMSMADQCFCGSGLPYWICCADKETERTATDG